MAERLGVDLPGEDKGIFPIPAVYNRVYRGSWNSCTNLTLGIGQDMMQATPLQLANAHVHRCQQRILLYAAFCKEIDRETAQDTLLNKFRKT